MENSPSKLRDANAVALEKKKGYSHERHLLPEVASATYVPEDSEVFKTQVVSATFNCASARSTLES
ncbi:hypothetical protein JCGZ_23717 [Jatropha curcas]|uniref:Uncharacterized protein n=1 Tax=Jatropha curcas TaxID=180498 RepID=A0A067JPH1_JATCU|nr:hypothetical protein JCGZ_23717 [Jatropha curcas]